MQSNEKGTTTTKRTLNNCKCTMTQSLLGDGCTICNPEMAKEIEENNALDDDHGPTKD